MGFHDELDTAAGGLVLDAFGIDDRVGTPEPRGGERRGVEPLVDQGDAVLGLLEQCLIEVGLQAASERREQHERPDGHRDGYDERRQQRGTAANGWLPDDELRVYSEEFGRTGFQGGLNWYRSGGIGAPEQELFAGRTIDQPSIFISGASDWGSYQSPGALERMQGSACTDMRGVHMVDGAGHWVQQEQPEQTSRLLIEFLRGA